MRPLMVIGHSKGATDFSKPLSRGALHKSLGMLDLHTRILYAFELVFNNRIVPVCEKKIISRGTAVPNNSGRGFYKQLFCVNSHAFITTH